MWPESLPVLHLYNRCSAAAPGTVSASGSRLFPLSWSILFNVKVWNWKWRLLAAHLTHGIFSSCLAARSCLTEPFYFQSPEKALCWGHGSIVRRESLVIPRIISSASPFTSIWYCSDILGWSSGWTHCTTILPMKWISSSSSTVYIVMLLNDTAHPPWQTSRPAYSLYVLMNLNLIPWLFDSCTEEVWLQPRRGGGGCEWRPYGR